ncbi:uncharacterized protein [Apteryx mantelli]|uniref:Uncharacterized protein isoform X1 n=1 Tax=Apteryx mantelli TaxID=2696672 RepID=A0A8B7JM16_9AVES
MAGRAQELVTFEDIAVYLNRAEWETIEEWQRELYRGVMVANYELLTSLGYPGPKPDILYRMEHGEEPWVSTPESPAMWDGPNSPSPGAGGNVSWLVEHPSGWRPGAARDCVPEERMETLHRVALPGRRKTFPNSLSAGEQCMQWRLRSRRLLNKFKCVSGGSQLETVATDRGMMPTENQEQERTGSQPGKEVEVAEEEEVEPNQNQNQSTGLQLHPMVARQNKNPDSQECVCGDPKEKLQGSVQKRPYTSEEMRLYLANKKQNTEGLNEVILKDHCYCARNKTEFLSSTLFPHVLRDHDYCRNGKDVVTALRDHEYCQIQRSNCQAQMSGSQNRVYKGAGSANKSRAMIHRLVKRKSQLQMGRLIRKAKRILWRYKRFVSKRLRFPPGSSSADSFSEPAGSAAVSPARAEDNSMEETCRAVCLPVEQETVHPQSQNEDNPQERPLEAVHAPAGSFESTAALPPSNAVAEAKEEVARPVTYVEHVQQWACPIQRFEAKQNVEGFRFINSEYVSLHDAYEMVMRTVDQMLDRVCQTFELGGYAQCKDIWPIVIQIDS